MNKNTIKIFSFVVGILSGVLAVCEIIRGLTRIDSIGVTNSSKFDTYIIITIILAIALAVFLGIISYFLIKEYVSKQDETKHILYPAIIYFSYQIIHAIITMCMWGFDASEMWLALIFGAAGLALIFVSLFATNVESKTKGILLLIAFGLGFILSSYFLFNSNGFSILINLLYDALFVMLFLYYLFNMMDNGQLTSSNNEEKDSSLE